MKYWKTRTAAMILVALMLLTGCSPIVEQQKENTSVYATFYPLYALTSMIADGAENVEAHCLVQPQDDCLRSYQLSDWDLYLLAYSADAVISAGSGLEGFSDKLKVMGETSLPVAEVMPGLDLYQTDGLVDEENHFSGAIPHLYMSVEGAEQIAERIEGSLSLLSEQNADTFEQNLVAFKNRLIEIRDEIKKQTEVCIGKSAAVLHEALFYTARDCGLEIAGWYERESGEMLSGAGLDDCLNMLRDCGAEIVLLEKQAPSALVKMLEEAGYTVVRLDIMSTLTESDGAEAYLEVLRSNALAVAEACSALE